MVLGLAIGGGVQALRLYQRLPEAPVGPSVRSGVSHPHAGAIGETEKAGALDVQQEHVDRIGGPAELQAPAGQRPGLDLGAGRKRPEVTVYESADDRPARAPRVEPSGNVWRAHTRGWSYESDFVDAVATLALRVAAKQ